MASAAKIAAAKAKPESTYCASAVSFHNRINSVGPKSVRFGLAKKHAMKLIRKSLENPPPPPQSPPRAKKSDEDADSVAADAGADRTPEQPRKKPAGCGVGCDHQDHQPPPGDREADDDFTRRLFASLAQNK